VLRQQPTQDLFVGRLGQVVVAAGEAAARAAQFAVLRRHQHQHQRAALDVAVRAPDVLAQRQTVERAVLAQLDVDEDKAIGALRQQLKRAGTARTHR